MTEHNVNEKEIKLFDMEKGKDFLKFSRGDSWRSSAVYQCEICHVRTNKWKMGGYLGIGPRILCPGDEYQEHVLLEEKTREYEQLGKQRTDYEESARTTQEEALRGRARGRATVLELDQRLVKEKIDSLRKRFSKKFDDVKGLNGDAKTIHYIPSSRYAEKKPLDGGKVEYYI